MYEVPAVYVVNEAVAVVVNAVARDLGGVRPDVRLKVGVVDVKALVNDGDDDRAAARRQVPGLFGLDVSADEARCLLPREVVEADLPRVLHRPLAGVIRSVVRRYFFVPDVVRLGVEHVGARAQRLHCVERLFGRDLNEAQALDYLAAREVFHLRGDFASVFGRQRRVCAPGPARGGQHFGAGAETHEHVSGHELSLAGWRDSAQAV